jgi:hypothetical protein
LLDRFVNRSIEGLSSLQIGGSQQFNQANPGPSTPAFALSGQKGREAMMSALGRGAISQSAAAAAAASSTGLKRLFANVVEQAKEGAAKKEGKHNPSSRFHLLLRSKTITLLVLSNICSCTSFTVEVCLS